jgi:transposase
MNERGFVTVSMRELERIKIIAAVAEHRLKVVQAAERLDLCERQVSRLVRRYETSGPAGLVSGRRGQPSNRELPIDIRARAMALVRERYADFGPTLACEKLRECHGVELAKETVRRWMCDAGLWIPRKQRPPKIHQPRNRRSCLGELIQIDGSDHRWFEERAPACTLLVFIGV